MATPPGHCPHCLIFAYCGWHSAFDWLSLVGCIGGCASLTAPNGSRTSESALAAREERRGSIRRREVGHGDGDRESERRRRLDSPFDDAENRFVAPPRHRDEASFLIWLRVLDDLTFSELNSGDRPGFDQAIVRRLRRTD